MIHDHNFPFTVQLRTYESNQTSLIQLVTGLMQRLPPGEEVVIPPDLVCFLEGYSDALNTGGISITVTHPAPPAIDS